MFGLSNKSDISSEPSIKNLLERGVENIYPSKEFLEGKLRSGNKMSIYLGVDPTAPTLHLGHAIVLKKLKEFQDLGHKIIFLVGDFTGMIGDPTNKSATRRRLTKEEVRKNASLYKEQAGVFLSFSGSNKAVIEYNSSWLSRISLGEIIEISSLVTVDQMLKRDMFEKRVSENKPIYLHEFLYPLFQGYDSVAMDVDGEIGGNDQTFNMLIGRDLMKQLKNKDKFVLSTKLLTDPTGKKMGKTEGNIISFLDTPKEKYGKVMSWGDQMIIPGFELCTYLSLEEIENIKNKLSVGENPKGFKMRLASEIVSIFNGKEEAKLAEESFKKTFEEGVPDSPTEIYFDRSADFVEHLKTSNIVSSSSEWKRLVDERAVEVVGGEIVKDYKFSPEANSVLKIGKKRFVKVLEK